MIKYFNKIWKSSFVILIIGLGFNLTSCGKSNDTTQTLINDFNKIIQTNVNDYNKKAIDNMSNSKNLITLTVDNLTPNLKQTIMQDWAITITLSGYYYLTGNAKTDYLFLKSQTLYIFNEVKNDNKKIIDKVLTKGDDFIWSITTTIISQDKSKVLLPTKFNISYLTYNKTIDGFNPGISVEYNNDNLNIKTIKEYFPNEH